MRYDLVWQSETARGCCVGCACVYSTNYQYTKSEICMCTPTLVGWDDTQSSITTCEHLQTHGGVQV